LIITSNNHIRKLTAYCSKQGLLLKETNCLLNNTGAVGIEVLATEGEGDVSEEQLLHLQGRSIYQARNQQ
jgi:hypothetical protein